jgi:hypothetical protein
MMFLKSTSALAAKPLNGIFALSNFALIAPVVIATSPVLPIVTAPDNSTAAASPVNVSYKYLCTG